MCARFPCCTEQFADVALTVPDIDAALRIREGRGRLPHILQPAIALLPLDGHPRRIDPFLQGTAAFELVARPELNRRQSRGSPALVTAKLECIRMPQTV